MIVRNSYLHSQRPKADQVPLTLGQRVDLILFGVLLCFVLLYRLQFVAPWITAWRVREVLYGYLYFRVFTFYRPRLTTVRFLVGVFLAFSVFVGLHTYYLYGMEMAVKGLMRFVNVALLAPLASTFLTSRRQFFPLLKIWLIVVFLAALSGVYQVLGGDLSWLTQGYMTSRGEVLRYMTLLGEPNVGGMAAPIVLLIAVYLMPNLVWKLLVTALAVVLMLISVSKAALAGMMLAVLLIVFFQMMRKDKASRRDSKRIMQLALASLATATVFVAGASMALPAVVENVWDYTQTLGVSFVGAGERTEVSPGFVTDLTERLVIMTFDGIELAQAQSDLYALDVLIGSSFGIVGTAAEEVRGPDLVITAHNGFSEIYFAGGLILLIMFLSLLVAVLRRLWLLSKYDRLYKVLLASFVICVSFIFIYPIMSNIGVGSLFWLTVGMAGNSRMTREVMLHRREQMPALLWK